MSQPCAQSASIISRLTNKQPYLTRKTIVGLVNCICFDVVRKQQPHVLCPIMHGAAFFGADIARGLWSFYCDPVWAPLTIKRRSDKEIAVEFGPKWEVYRGRHVLIVDTIVDTGHTLEVAIRTLQNAAGPASITVATLIARDSFDAGPIKSLCNWMNPGVRTFSKDYFVGYGLDVNGAARGCPDIYNILPTSDIPDSLLGSMSKGNDNEATERTE